jgi:hypothetical protein
LPGGRLKFSSLKLNFLSSAILVSALLVGCGEPKVDCNTPEGRAAIIDSVNTALSSSDCTTAIENIEAAYSSGCSNNEIRLARASAYGCAANINFFKLLGDLSTEGISSGGLWKTFAKLFHSSTQDSRAEAGWYASDALMAVLESGIVLAPTNKLSFDGNNIASTRTTDRTDVANLYLMLTSMATLGASQNRYSAPDLSTYSPTQVLGYTTAKPTGWASAANMTLEGCAYASSVLNLFDTMTEISGILPTSLSSSVSSVSGTYSAALDLVCEAGCAGTGVYAATGCALPAGTCTPCPTSLRHRSACALGGSVTDPANCAAAGIAIMINTDATLGWQ